MRFSVAVWLVSDLLPGTFLGSVEPLELNSVIASVVYGGLVGKLLVLTSLLTIWITYWRSVKNSFNGRVVWLLTAIYCVFYMAWSFFGIQDSPQSARCLTILITVGLGYFAALVCNDGVLLARVITTVVSLQAGYAICYALTNSHSFISGTVSRASGTYGNPMVLYPVLLFGLPLAVVLSQTTKIRILRCLWGVCGGLIMLALTLTWYRWGMVSAAVALIWLTTKLAKDKRGVGVVVVFFTALVALTVRIRTNGLVNQTSADGSWQGRRLLWSSGFDVFKHHWLTGIGAARLSLPAFSGHFPHLHQITMLHPCSLLLLWMCEGGIGAAMLLLMFCWFVGRALNARSTAVAWGYLAGWTGIIMASLMDTPFGYIDRDVVNIIAGAFIGAVLLLADNTDAKPQDFSPDKDMKGELSDVLEAFA